MERKVRGSNCSRYLFAALALLILSVLIGVFGCDGPRLGAGSTVNLNQLWGMAAQETGSYADGAILVEFEMTLSPVEGNSLPPEQTARIERLHSVAWSHGRSVDVTATWPERGLGELSTETHESRNDMPRPVGYSLSKLLSCLDYVGVSGLYVGLQGLAGGRAIRLRLVYPPPSGPYGQEWRVPLVLLRGSEIGFTMSADVRAWLTSPGVFQVLSGSSERLLAILAVADN